MSLGLISGLALSKPCYVAGKKLVSMKLKGNDKNWGNIVKVQNH